MSTDPPSAFDRQYRMASKGARRSRLQAVDHTLTDVRHLGHKDQDAIVGVTVRPNGDGAEALDDDDPGNRQRIGSSQAHIEAGKVSVQPPSIF